MKISTIIDYLEILAPPALQESYDNSGLIIGNKEAEISSVLLCLDSTEEVIDEAIERGCGMVIAHHPILFSGLTSLTGKNYIERTLLKAIKNDVAIYAIHTNLDNVNNGVNRKIAQKIGLENLEILNPKKSVLNKLVFFCPTENIEEVKNAVFKAGGGTIGAYDFCSFSSIGEGTFRASESANPHVGEKGILHREEEYRVEIVLPSYLKNKVLSAMMKAHPYEEVAFDLYALENSWREVGSGMIGDLPQKMDSVSFLDHLKKNLGTDCVRHTELLSKEVKRIAVCGGSGSFLLNNAIAKKADVFVTADYKYHQFFDADKKIVIADVGHFESEQHTPELIQEYFQENLPNFASYLSKINTNPINYR
ncbi:MAG: Nif3-like dinuclear metal center hexameric protein [Flavobacteriales bacterium]|nr:Nif3-like dinuclear metal center hexameric protein [Flavobacteriales bacterium]